MLVRQCLHTSNFDFYRLDSRNFIRSENFQCPRTGNSHFYRLGGITMANNINVCQCPRTGNLHFYGAERTYYDNFCKVSMPSYGQLTFLQ